MIRDIWRLDDVLALPSGENDLFERQRWSPTDLKGLVSKALSAFANTGGGHIIIGVQDDGTVTGCPESAKGRQSSKDWIERLVQAALDPPLQSFRVHEIRVESPAVDGPVVLVVDVGDSEAAPHQSREHTQYLYRIGSNSVPAPHFHLELLRNRRTAPVIVAESLVARAIGVTPHPGGVQVLCALEAHVRNTGRVTANHLMCRWEGATGSEESRVTELDLTTHPQATALLEASTAERLHPTDRQRLFCPITLVFPRHDPVTASLNPKFLSAAISPIELKIRFICGDHVAPPATFKLGDLIDGYRLAAAIRWMIPRVERIVPLTRDGATVERYAGWGMRVQRFVVIPAGSKAYEIQADLESNSPFPYSRVSVGITPPVRVGEAPMVVHCRTLHDVHRGQGFRIQEGLVGLLDDLTGGQLVVTQVTPVPRLLLGRDSPRIEGIDEM